MDYFVYKSAKISLFQPKGSVSQGFTFPEKLKPLLKGKPSPIIYIFEKEPSEKTIKEYELEKSFTLDECKDINDLRETLKDKDLIFWKAVLLF